MTPPKNAFLHFSERLDVLPVVHGSGDFAVRAREQVLTGGYDCLAVPLPGSFGPYVLEAIERLPAITAVVQPEPEEEAASFVPIDPCQPVIAAIRCALQERMTIEFVDLETQRFESRFHRLPDPYALKVLPVEKYLAAALPALEPPPSDSQADRRVRRMAFELHRLELDHARVLFLPNVLEWPWIRDAYMRRLPYPEHEPFAAPIVSYRVDPRTLVFFLGELPFITALYERARQQLGPDENLSIDGVKELVLEARDRWGAKRKQESRWLTPKLLQIYFQYVRNLTLLERRLSPDLYTLVVAAKQIGGDGFARVLLEAARDYAVESDPPPGERLRMGIGQADLGGAGVHAMNNRLPGLDVAWRACELRPEPPEQSKKLWRTRWDPYQQCSYPPEDDRIESFHTHVREQAKALLGADLARSEKFTTSVKDGLDIRETLRHWHTGDLYVKELPPARGGLEIVVFLFEHPLDPDKYTWRTTWLAEHEEESTLGLVATDFSQDIIGPGIGRARYGAVFFMFPPRYIPDIWSDPRLPRGLPIEDHLIAAALFHSTAPHVALVTPIPLRASWRRLAKRYKKRLIPIPLSRFSGRTIDRIRQFHVLNGKHIRTYAASFIREE